MAKNEILHRMLRSTASSGIADPVMATHHRRCLLSTPPDPSDSPTYHSLELTYAKQQATSSAPSASTGRNDENLLSLPLKKRKPTL